MTTDQVLLGVGLILVLAVGSQVLTDEDDFNALACADLAGSVDGRVYRLGPWSPGHGVVAPYTGGETLFGAGLTRSDVGHRYAGGHRSSPSRLMVDPGRRRPAVPGAGERRPGTGYAHQDPGTQGGGRHDPARPLARGFVMLPAHVHAQHPAGLAKAQACGGRARGRPPPASGAETDDG